MVSVFVAQQDAARILGPLNSLDVEPGQREQINAVCRLEADVRELGGLVKVRGGFFFGTFWLRPLVCFLFLAPSVAAAPC